MQQPMLMLLAGESLIALQFTWVCKDIALTCAWSVRWYAAAAIELGIELQVSEKTEAGDHRIGFTFDGWQILLFIARQARKTQDRPKRVRFDGVHLSCAWLLTWAAATRRAAR